MAVLFLAMMKITQEYLNDPTDFMNEAAVEHDD